MNYTYQIVNPQDIVLGIDHIQVEYNIVDNPPNSQNSGIVTCSLGYTLTSSTDPSQPNRTNYVVRTCIIESNRIACANNSFPNVTTDSINSIRLNIISSLGNIIVSIDITDNFGIAQNYCILISFIIVYNTGYYDIEDIVVNAYNPEAIIDYTVRPTKLGFHNRNSLLRSYHSRVSTAPVRYTNSISDVVSNCNFVPYLSVQDRYFVINYDNDETSEYAAVNLSNVKISGWTDRDIYFFEKVYADVSDPNTSINDETGLLEPLVADPYDTTEPFTLVHNMYPLSIHRNGEIVVYNNQPKGFPYVTSLFHTANVSQIKYNNSIYNPLTPYMYYRTIVAINHPTMVEILYSYLNRSYIAITTVQSSTRLYSATSISTDTVTRNLLLPIDYNILLYLESQWYRLLGTESMRIFVTNHNDEVIEYPVIMKLEGDHNWNGSLVIFRRDGVNAVTMVKDRDVDLGVMRWGLPMSFFSGGGLLGWGRHKPGYDSKYYLFSWYKILRTKRLVSANPNSTSPDDYLRYYYYYQHII